VASQDQFMLLDRQHQALGFDDMVVAVRSHRGHTPVDFACQRSALRPRLSRLRTRVLDHPFC
jgi:hypothetical protein